MTGKSELLINAGQHVQSRRCDYLGCVVQASSLCDCGVTHLDFIFAGVV
jgi:hypothetical protein